VNAFSGPLIVGGLAGGPSEARWLNYYQSAGTLLTLYANGLVNLNNTTERFGSITFNGGQIDSGPFGICVLGSPFNTNASYLNVNAAITPAIINGFFGPAGGAAWITVSNGVADPDLLINAGVVGSAPQIIKQGAGTMRLAGAGNYIGVTIVNEGTLEVAHNAALGSASYGTIVNIGATLRLSTFNPVPEGFALFGTGVGGTDGVLHAIGNTTVTGSIFLNGPSTINVGPGALLAVDNRIGGTGPLTKTGTGNFYLGGVSGGTGNNTYSGDTVVSAGLLYLSKNQGVRAVPGNLIVGNGATGPATARFNRSGLMNASATITVNANGLLDLNGQDQTVPRLNLNDGGEVQTGAGTLGFSAGGVVSVGTLNSFGVGLRLGSSISGKIALPILDYLIFTVAPYGAAPFPGEGPELNVSAVIRDAGNIIKTGAGALRLGGANTFNDAPPNFSGDVFVNAGTLIAAHATALGGTAGWTYVNNSASLALLEGITITGENLYLNSDHPRALDNIAGNNTWTGPISLTRDTTVASSLDWSLTTSGVIGGAGRLRKVGAGVLWLSGSANNTHAGDTFVDEGWLGLAKSAFVQAVPHNLIIGQPAGGAFAAVLHVSTDQIWGNVTVNPGGGLNLNGYQEYIGNLTLNGGGDVFTGNGTLHLTTVAVNPGAFADQSLISGRLGLNANSVPITVGPGTMAGGAAHCLITASIVQSAGTSRLLKSGGGRLQLTGTNTYTGVTYVGDGTLQVDGVQPQSTVELDHDTRLQGAGTVGHILFNGTTAIAPGTSAGTLTCRNFDASGGAGKLEMELNGHPTGYDQIIALGLVDLRGLALQASLNFVSSTGQQFTLINNDGSDTVTGTFDGLPQNAPLTIGNESFVISYTGGTGNDVVLTRVPTPPRPVLTIETIPSASVRLKWPTNFPGYTLQLSTNLSATNWSTVTPPPVVTGTNRVVTNTTASSPKFYRLKN
jgi:fibronectin-binding autotransporter adhesin